MDLEGEIGRLYGLDRDTFVAERDAAVRRFRGEGDREGAERLRALRKPTVAAWAVNRLARDRPGEVSDLLGSVDELGVAQAQAVKGDPGRFREAAEAHRGAIEGLVDAAQRILEEADSASASTLERVRETLHAVSVDPQARELLRAGRLDRERQPGGLDALGLAGAVPVEEARGEETAAGQGSTREEARGKETAVGQASAREEAPGKATAVGRAAAQEDAQRRRAASRKARDAVRTAERRAESARRRLDREEAAAAKADAAREEARLALQEAEREHAAATRRELELRAEG
ncbi:MAG: hypothetical protein ACR2ML_09405 [Solirubrobacteraceae bacterium]